MSELLDEKLDRERDYKRKHYRKRVEHAAQEMQKLEKQNGRPAFPKDVEARRDFRDRRKKEHQGKKKEGEELSDDDLRKVNRHQACDESFRYKGLRRRRWWERELPEWVPGVPNSGIETTSTEEKPSSYSSKGAPAASSKVKKTKPPIEYKTRKQALSGGYLPTSPEENLRVAVEHLKSLPVAQRPASRKGCKAWLARCGCHAVRVDLLVPPGALAEELVPLLASDTPLQRAVMALAKAGSCLSKGDPGPEPGHVSDCARRAKIRLYVVRQMFLDWPFAERARWLCAQSVGILRSSPVTILDAMLEAGLASCDDKACLHWNLDKLEATPAPIKSAEWIVEDFSQVLDLGVRTTIHVPLPLGLKGQESVKSIRDEGVTKVAARWRGFGLATCGNDAPLLADLKIQFGTSEATKAREILLHTLVIAADDAKASDFVAKLKAIVVDDVNSNFSPPQFRLEDLKFRGEIRQFIALEMALGCTLAIDRDECGCFDASSGSLTVTLRKHGTATESQIREILGLVFNKSCAFKCPTPLTHAKVQQINEWKSVLRMGELRALEQKICASLEFPEKCTGDLHIFGHPYVDALELGRGVSLAAQRFQTVASDAPRLVEDALPEIFERIKSLEEERKQKEKEAQIAYEASKLHQQQLLQEQEDMWKSCENGQKLTLISNGPSVSIK